MSIVKAITTLVAVESNDGSIFEVLVSFRMRALVCGVERGMYIGCR